MESLLQEAQEFLKKRHIVVLDAECIDKANEISFNELVETERPDWDGYVDFCGQNCEDCPGWDGESKRCACGNRRVYWTFSGNFTNMYVYACAD